MSKLDSFHPSKHEYFIHPQYTGIGCCICGQAEGLHARPVHRSYKFSSSGNVVLVPEGVPDCREYIKYE